MHPKIESFYMSVGYVLTAPIGFVYHLFVKPFEQWYQVRGRLLSEQPVVFGKYILKLASNTHGKDRIGHLTTTSYPYSDELQMSICGDRVGDKIDFLIELKTAFDLSAGDFISINPSNAPHQSLVILSANKPYFSAYPVTSAGSSMDGVFEGLLRSDSVQIDVGGGLKVDQKLEGFGKAHRYLMRHLNR